MFRRITVQLLLTLSLFLTYPALVSAEPSNTKVKLVTLVVVDQLAFDTFERMRGSFRYGLKRLLEKGALFTDVHHDHLATETCPGHATIVTGKPPSKSGIVGNDYYDAELKRIVTCTYDPLYGESPRALQVETFSDWLKERNARSKSYAVSGKSRSSIMLAGKKGDGAYWFDRESGLLVTSRYYPLASKNLIERFDSRGFISSYLGKSWTPHTALNAIPAAFAVATDRAGMAPGNFPYAFGGASLVPDRKLFESIYQSPVIDQLTTQAAIHLLGAENLGKSSAIDFLGVSYSALDIIGHRYGPHSPEVFDVLEGLDTELGKLLDRLDRQVGKDQYLFTLTADHGIPPLPEHLAKQGINAHRQNAEGINCLQQVAKRLSSEYGVSFADEFSLDFASRNKISGIKEQFFSSAKSQLERCPGIAQAWISEELHPPETSIHQRRAMNSYHPTRGANIQILPEPYFAQHPLHGVNHGTSYDYDTHVPLLIVGPGIKSSSIVNSTTTTEIAPLMATIIGITAAGQQAEISPLIKRLFAD